jgi:hypothetical protein
MTNKKRLSKQELVKKFIELMYEYRENFRMYSELSDIANDKTKNNKGEFLSLSLRVEALRRMHWYKKDYEESYFDLLKIIQKATKSSLKAELKKIETIDSENFKALIGFIDNAPEGEVKENKFVIPKK